MTTETATFLLRFHVDKSASQPQRAGRCGHDSDYQDVVYRMSAFSLSAPVRQGHHVLWSAR